MGKFILNFSLKNVLLIISQNDPYRNSSKQTQFSESYVSILWSAYFQNLHTAQVDVYCFRGRSWYMLMIFFLFYYRRIPDSFRNVLWPMLMLILPQKVNNIGLIGKDVIMVAAVTQFINDAPIRKANPVHGVRDSAAGWSRCALASQQL